MFNVNLKSYYPFIQKEIDKFFFTNKIPNEERQEYYEHAYEVLNELLNEHTSLSVPLIVSSLEKSFLKLKEELANITQVDNNLTFHKYAIRSFEYEEYEHSTNIMMWFLDENRKHIQVDAHLTDKFWSNIEFSYEENRLIMNEKARLMDELLLASKEQGFLSELFTSKDSNTLLSYMEWLPEKQNQQFISLEISDVTYNEYTNQYELNLKFQFTNTPHVKYYQYCQFYSAIFQYNAELNIFEYGQLHYDEFSSFSYNFTDEQFNEIERFILSQFEFKRKELVNQYVYAISKNNNSYFRAILRETKDRLPYLELPNVLIFFFDENDICLSEEEAFNSLKKWKEKDCKQLKENDRWIHELFDEWSDNEEISLSKIQAMKDIIKEKLNIEIK